MQICVLQVLQRLQHAQQMLQHRRMGARVSNSPRDPHVLASLVCCSGPKIIDLDLMLPVHVWQHVLVCIAVNMTHSLCCSC